MCWSNFVKVYKFLRYFVSKEIIDNVPRSVSVKQCIKRASAKMFELPWLTVDKNTYTLSKDIIDSHFAQFLDIYKTLIILILSVRHADMISVALSSLSQRNIMILQKMKFRSLMWYGDPVQDYRAAVQSTVKQKLSK